MRRRAAEGTRRVAGGGDDAAAHVVLQPRKKVDRNVGQVGRRPRALGALGVQALAQLVLAPSCAADHHRQALELRVAQPLDRRVERVHVEVGDAAGFGRHER